MKITVDAPKDWLGETKTIKLSGSDLRKLERGDKLTINGVTIYVDHTPDDDEHRTNHASPGDKASW